MATDRKGAMEELLRDMYRMMARADVREATGLVVVIYDPEVDSRRYIAFPKDLDRARAYAERTQTMLNADGDGPAIVCTVELLFSPEDE